MTEERNHMPDKKDVALGIAAGAVLGALAGILFAPKSGKQTRADIAKFADEMKQRVAKRVHEVGKLSREQYNTIVDTVVEEGGATWKIAKEDLIQLRNDLKDRYEAVKTRLASEGK